MAHPANVVGRANTVSAIQTFIRSQMIERHIELVMPAGHTLMVHAYGSGKPLLLVHGFPLDAMIWRPCCDDLVAAGFQVFLPDLRGFGKSSEITEGVTIADLASDIEQIRRFLIGNDKYVLGGLSLGGYVAFEVWKRYGEHLRALILSNTKPQADSEEGRQTRLAMAKKALDESTWSAVAPMLGKLLSPPTSQQHPEIVAHVEAMMSAVPANTVSAIQHAMATRHDFSGELSLIKIPTLVITGEHDPISPPEENKRWSAKIPNARLNILAGAAHLPQVEATAELCQAITQFLSD